MLVRLLVVVGFVLLAFVVVSVAERFKSRAKTRIPPGLTLVVKPGCRECVLAKAKLDELGALYSEVDVTDAEVYGIPSYTVPYAFVGSPEGALVMVRRGKAVAFDAESLADAALVCC